MKITLISLDNWGFNKHIAEVLEKKGHIVNHIDFNSFKYKYPNFNTRLYNFILKKMYKKNVKNIYYGKEIIKRLQQLNEKQDIILTIKGDFIDTLYLKELKKYTDKSIGFFNDNTIRCPKIIPAIPCFHQVFSFEKEDCQKYHLEFASNWIYLENKVQKTKTFDYEVFNISSKDSRLAVISNIAKDLKSNKINYKIMVLDKKATSINREIEFFNEKISLVEVSNLIARSKTLLDINRKGQNGLTFRVFESLGLEKKLITTNSDIKNYDFYNPNNILVINENNPIIPKAFFNNEYEEIPKNILQKYSIDGWIETVLFDKYN
jgi:hypothetical protein